MPFINSLIGPFNPHVHQTNIYANIWVHQVSTRVLFYVYKCVAVKTQKNYYVILIFIKFTVFSLSFIFFIHLRLFIGINIQQPNIKKIPIHMKMHFTSHNWPISYQQHNDFHSALIFFSFFIYLNIKKLFHFFLINS